MSVSSNRKLNNEQLINLAQVYWDEPGKLQEISEAIEARMDPAAQLLFGAISNRLDNLQKDPIKALGEEAPNLAALIAARLGQKPPAPEERKEARAEAARAVPREKKPSRKRGLLMPVAGTAAAVLIGLATWWWWPVKNDSEDAAVARKAGIEIQEQGVRPEEEVRRGGARSSPTGQRRGEFPDPRDFDPFAGADRAADAGDPELKEASSPAAREVREVDQPEEARAARAGGAAAAGSAAAPAAAPPAAAGARSPRQSNPAAGGRAGGGGTSAAASAANGVSDSQLQCFLSDDRPNECAPQRGGGGPAAGGAGGSGTSGGGSPSAGRTPSSEAMAGGSPPSSSRSSSSPPERSRSSGNGGSGGSGAGGGAGGESSDGGPPPARGRPAAQASSKGGGGAAQQPQRQPPPQPMQQSQSSSDPDCPAVPPDGRVVFIFDGSISMGLPLGLDPAEEDRLDEGTRRREPGAREEYRALLREPGPKRMGRAQDAFAEAAEELPDFVELGLVVFQECRDIRQVGVFDAARRGTAIDYIYGLMPRGRTPLAQSLMVAQEMLGDKGSSVVLLTDGREFCSGDPCAAAQYIKATRPGVPIHIIDIAGQGRTDCVAEVTGGRSYSPAETDDLAEVIRAAFRGAAGHCPAR